ncbi:stalk domain-containing protein [Paenibacillus lautus]|uniref:stalk domain-containing protein n=1 Tax=Paenibacillus lautus TaxID=1401 RepID=UPI000FDB9FA0|nr:stalk domain-containing protein [Paenibacillus lautus]
MKDKLKGLVIGITIGSMLTGVTAYAAGNNTIVRAVVKKVTLYIDGKKTTSTNALIYNGTTYIPARSVSNSIAKQVSLQGNNLYIGKQPKTKITEEHAFELVYNKIKKEADKLSLNFMLQGIENNSFVIRVFEDHDDYIVTYGFYYVNQSTGKISKMDIITGEIKEL